MLTTSHTLLQRVKNPTDQAAWDSFVGLYTPFLYRCGLRYGLSDADAADLVQDVFVLLIQKLPFFHYEPDGSFRGWLKRTTLNKCHERARRKALPMAGGDEVHAVEAVIDPAQQQQCWEVAYRRDLLARALDMMRLEFEPRTWQACWQHAILGESASTVAANLGMTTAAVYTHTSRVLKRLRQDLSDLL